MTSKLKFLTKISLNKKIKTKWFLIANLIFAVLIIGLINIDVVIKAFGGDFSSEYEIIVIDEASVYDNFENNFNNYSKYLEDYDGAVLSKYEGDYDSAKELVKEEDKILLVISLDDENYLRGKVVSNESLGTITSTLISTVLTSVRSDMVLKEYNITEEMLDNINKSVILESEVLVEDDVRNNMTISSIMQVITMPVFMLIIFLVQMIGAEVNEEKTTKSMEIIISNVSPKTHFISKIISANLFVIIQGILLILFVTLGIGIRYFLCGGNLVGEFENEISDMVGSLSLTGVIDTLSYMIPIIIAMMLLTFLAYSLLAGVLASMTTNLEDFQQLQTPIVIVSLVGYYLSIMAGVFKGSLFIKIMGYVPFISSMLAPTLYVMGEFSLIDLLGSILLLILIIFLLIKYGLKIYKVGILNYSQSGLWKKMFKAMKE